MGLDVQGAEFVAAGGGGGVDEPPLVDVSIENKDGAWKVTGWGQCRPVITLPAGLNPAEWRVDFEQPLPGPATTEFDALVTERECASGQPSEGRIVGPQIIWSDDVVLIAFAVRALGGQVQTCQGNPSTRVHVALEAPLGGRRLLDPSLLPFTDPTTCELPFNCPP
ncbi:MAG: hypothetical protein L0221_17780 [Chloroflexi bacterium]|nr:hypothetical protein [Chloroflexota bacterium]